MCGIAGFWGKPDHELLARMAGIVAHRGPDQEGFHETDVASIAARRLAIIDISKSHQPMSTPDGLLHMTYNAEVYNYRELREELRALGHQFLTDGDTEVVLHAYQEWGPASFARLNGMWGLAIIDLREAGAPKVILSRDHFGIKPVYWAKAGDRVVFGSEIKSLLLDPALRTAPNEQRIYEYLGWGLHDQDDKTFFEGISSLPAASYAVVDASGVKVHRYWEPKLSTDGNPDPREFRRLMSKSVERRLVADVPVGTCLSGGLDSSSIVALMSEQLRAHVPDAKSMGDRLKTFSAVFPGDAIDERSYIDEVLAASGAEGNFVEPTSERFLEEVADVVWHADEPMVSTGPYAQWCVMRLARKKVTVLLDGQGGDELLAGYVSYHYVYLKQLLRERKYLRFLREAAAARDVLAPLVRRRLGERRKRLSIGSLLKPEYRARVKPPVDERVSDDLKKRLLQDLTAYSLPSLLRYDDRNSMAHSVESRVPFLDQELVEWVLTLPPDAIIRNGWSRAILRDGMKGLLPERIRLRRWKVGFTTPEMRWLKAQRREIEALFASPGFRSRPYWNADAVRDAFVAACDGRAEESLVFWRAMNVEIWLRVFFDRTDRTPPSGDGVVTDWLPEPDAAKTAKPASEAVTA